VGSGLQIDENLAFQKLEWRVQRVGLGCLAGAVLFGLLGGFGAGPLARTTAQSPDGAIQLDYDRFVRVGVPTRLTLRALRPLARIDAISFPAEYLARVHAVIPTTASIEEIDGRVTIALPDLPTSAPVVVLELQPGGPGLRRAALDVDGKPLGPIWQLAYF
jgi:hypothetical protein